jgi:hypothetical protein
MLHPSSNQAHQTGKKNSTSFISIFGSKCGGGGKNLKISYSMLDNSAIWKAIAVRFSLLDRARRAAHCANIGFSIPDYSPVLHRLKCPAQQWTLTDDPVLVSPSGESVYIDKTQCGDTLSTQPLALLYTTNWGRIQPMFWVVSVTSTEKAKGLWPNADSFMR